MTNSAITKTIKKVNSNLNGDYGDNLTLGQKRYFALPVRVVRCLNLKISIDRDTLNVFKPAVDFLEKMTDTEYINYLKLS